MTDDENIVYSSDGSGKNLVNKKKKKETFSEVIPQETTLKLRIEKIIY